jgi:hypothetical protein
MLVISLIELANDRFLYSGSTEDDNHLEDAHTLRLSPVPESDSTQLKKKRPHNSGTTFSASSHSRARSSTIKSGSGR